jgi:hypothetical protein
VIPASDSELRQRFAQWAIVYGGEQYRRLGFSSLERIGAPAASDEKAVSAHELEDIVKAMETSGRWKEARVLRTEYFLASLPEKLRLNQLRRMGLIVSRASYYIYLESARAFVAGALAQR